MTPTVKICGIRTADTLQSIRHLPIDHIGFIFAPSKRRVTPEQAGKLIADMRGAWPGGSVPLAFGVFVSPTRDELAQTLAEAPLDVVQLHSEETPEYAAWIRGTFGVKVYIVVSAAGGETEDDVSVKLDRYRGAIDGLLLDTAGGGTGRTFEWDRIPPFAVWAERAGIPLLVAGGLHPDNVAELIGQYRPSGVDVSSGVETDGVKDISKIAAFVERVKGSVH